MIFRVRVSVGEPSETQIFVFARNRLCTKAHFLVTAFGGKFIESQIELVVLDDVSIEDFHHSGNFFLNGRLLPLPLGSMPAHASEIENDLVVS